jgi:hypothetical protein
MTIDRASTCRAPRTGDGGRATIARVALARVAIAAAALLPLAVACSVEEALPIPSCSDGGTAILAA